MQSSFEPTFHSPLVKLVENEPKRLRHFCILDILHENFIVTFTFHFSQLSIETLEGF